MDIEYKFVEGKSPRDYFTFSSKDEIAGEIRKNFSGRALSDGSFNRDEMLDMINRVVNRDVCGYRIKRCFDSLEKPYWIIQSYCCSKREN